MNCNVSELVVFKGTFSLRYISSLKFCFKKGHVVITLPCLAEETNGLLQEYILEEMSSKYNLISYIGAYVLDTVLS